MTRSPNTETPVAKEIAAACLNVLGADVQAGQAASGNASGGDGGGDGGDGGAEAAPGPAGVH